MSNLDDLKEKLTEEQLLMVDKRLEILFKQNPNRKHPVIQHLFHQKSEEIIYKILGAS